MKICPYCREEVQDEAIKCRFCHSMLLPIEAREVKEEDDRVTYILDRSIVRFGKFAAAILGIFIVFGLYVFGLDIKKMVEKMDEAKNEIKEVTQEMNAAREQMTTAQKELRATREKMRQLQSKLEESRKDVERVNKDVQALLRKIKEHETTAATIVGTLQLTVLEKSTLEEKREKKPELFRTSGKRSNWKLWPVGKTLRIRFMDGDPTVHAKVEKFAKEWTKYANIGFEFGSSAPDAEIRISFQNPGAWSYTGTDSLAVSRNDPTMNLGWLTQIASDEESRRIVLHEFGHVLGLIHEHNNPNAQIHWDTEAVYKYYSKPPFFMGKEEVDSGILKKYDLPWYRKFDSDSIMMYFQIPSELTTNDFEVVKLNSELSKSDKEFIAELYPF